MDTILAIDRHQIARYSKQHVPNCVSGVRARHALKLLLAFLRCGDGASHTLFVYAVTKPLGTHAPSRNNFGKSRVVDYADSALSAAN